jgi:ribonuclease E
MSDPASAGPDTPGPALSGPSAEISAERRSTQSEPPGDLGGQEGEPDTINTGQSRRRRRGSRGGRSRSRLNPGAGNGAASENGTGSIPTEATPDAPTVSRGATTNGPRPAEVRPSDPSSHPSGPAAIPGPAVIPGPAAVRPRIGDSRPAPVAARPVAARPGSGTDSGREPTGGDADRSARRRRRNGRSRIPVDRRPVEAVLVDEPVVVDDETLERRRGRERKGRPIGRYLMVVHSQPAATQIAVLEGRSLIEHYVSRKADDATQIDGNIYIGRVQNVLPGMEAAFIDIGTPKNAVLYRGDVRYDKDDIEAPAPGDSTAPPTRGRLAGAARGARIEQLIKTGQSVLCQVTKNPIGTKGARLTQEVSLPGRFVVLIPGSDTYGISKRLPDDERRRLRRILDEVRPEGHGLIVRTAAEGATADELRRDVARLSQQWDRIDALAKSSRTPALLYREPDMAVRVIREEFNREYRGVVIDDRALFEEVRDYVASISPELADRVEWAGDSDDPLPVFERHHVHEQIHRALDRKVWLSSGGSLIIERTEALTVIDVNTGKNVGTSNLEETVFRNNLEAAEEIARQLRLRDIGGIIVIDFIDMEVAAHRAQVIKAFRDALARDKTRTQVFDISDLGLVEMTRKRISEGLVESFSETCPTCGGRGIIFDESLL